MRVWYLLQVGYVQGGTHLENLEKSLDLRVVRENVFCTHEMWPIVSQENHWNSCYQMSDFKAKMCQIRLQLGLHLRPCWVAYSAPPDLAGFKGAYF